MVALNPTHEYAIHVEGLHKSFGKVHALRGIDFDVPHGTVLGMLGPNGAGKTTAVRVLTTLLPPDAGAVRRAIALAGQATAIVLELTGRENLEIIGQLRHLSKQEVKLRGADLLESFDLVEAADRPAKTYSGGMKRRLDLAPRLPGGPPLPVLDEA